MPNFIQSILIPPFCSFLLAQKMNQKRAKNPMLQHAKPTRPSLDFWASPPKRTVEQSFQVNKTRQTRS
jgi:hypothetical protein